MSRRILGFVLLVLLGAGLAGQTPPVSQPASEPAIRLVVLVAIDQFRYDYLWRFRREYAHGLQRLLTHGAVFTSAFLEHYPTVTAVGHATMLSGATPSVSGIIGNDWFDRDAGRSVQSITDETVTLVGGSGAGASPRRLLVSTIGDELKMAAAAEGTAPPRVIGMSAKDRGAILPVGRGADAAFWLPKPDGPFVSSTYYVRELPAWVAAFNRTPPPTDGGRVDTNARVLGLAIAALDGERLGQRGATDLLSISFSDNDTVGHAFGPESAQVREVSRAADRLLGELLTAVDRRVGLARCLVVLTADHGVAPMPEALAGQHMGGGRIEGGELFGAIRAALQARFGPGEWILGTAGSSPYLNHALIAERGLDAEAVRQVAAEAAARVPSVVRVYTRDQLLRGEAAGDLIGRRVLRGFNAARSGDLEIVLEPYWLRQRTGTTHGTPYNYDAHIPLIFMGPGIVPGTYHRRVALNDLAPTLAAVLRIEVPSGADGRVLEEMFAGGAVRPDDGVGAIW